MNELEAIQNRISRRHYAGPLAEDAAAAIEAKALQLNQEEGLCLSLVRDAPDLFGGFAKSYGMFSGVRSLLVVAGRTNTPYLYEKAGHAGEQLVLLATMLGQGSCWVGGSFDRGAVSARLPDDATLVAVITLGPVAELPALRERALRGAIHLRRQPPNWQTTETPPEWFLSGCAAAALAPSALNRHPVRFGYHKGLARAAIPADSQPHQHIDLGIAKLHFELAVGGSFSPGSPAVFRQEA